jgi:dimethylhistidine N-methyltransferase
MLIRTAIRPDRRSGASGAFAFDVIEGLSARRKRLPAKYFYDTEGSCLFEEITRLPEYYPTRTELGILSERAAEIAGPVEPGTALVEFGSGAATKVRLLLGAVPHICAYVPVDISVEFMNGQATRLMRDFPRLDVLPVAADFTGPFDLPARLHGRPLIGFFPGSTIGNFEPREASAFLRHAAKILGPDARLIVGADLAKDQAVLHAAYNDAAGVTARFNLNLLARIKRELDADIDLDAFLHQAFYNPERARIEMHLVSLVRQRVHVAGHTFAFRAGETIHTENSYKFTPGRFAALVRNAGWTQRSMFTDPDSYFSVHALVAK